MYLILFLGGALLGSLASGVPQRLFLRGELEMSKASFVESFPNLRWVALTFPAVHLLSLLPAGFIFMSLFRLSFASHPQAFVFFFPLFVFTGVSISSAIYELVAGVSPTAYRDRNTYIVHPGARKCGIFRVALLVLVTCAAIYSCWIR